MILGAYTLAPLVATIAFIPLLVVVAMNQPWQKRHFLFFIYMLFSMVWNLSAYFFRANTFPEQMVFFSRFTLVMFMASTVMFHFFISSYYPQGKGKWLPFAGASTVVGVFVIMMGWVTGDVIVDGAKIYPQYTLGVFALAIPLLVLYFRNMYVFRQVLKNTNDPLLHNQVFTLILGINVLTVFTIFHLLPLGREFPISHFGNLINGFILTYAVVRHHLVDIRIVMRRGTAWFSLALIGAIFFWILLIISHRIFSFELNLIASFTATGLACFMFFFLYLIRDRIFKIMNRIFQGNSYDYFQQLNEFTNKIHNVFSLKEQGGELLSLLVKALNIKQASLLFPEAGIGDYKTQFVESNNQNSQLSTIRLRANSPIIKYLEKEQKVLHRENLQILPIFLSLWPQEKEEIEAKNISMFIPLISRDRLIAILVLGEKVSGKYSLEDVNIMENASMRVAVSIEKEYLREQLREREEELSVINNSNVILSSSLDIQESFGAFIEELKKVIDVAWAGIVLIEDSKLVTMALSSPEMGAYQIGDKVPMEGSGTGWVITQKKPFIEYDLSQEKYFNTSEHWYDLGMRTTGYFPLIAKGRIIGSLIIMSKLANAYGPRHIKLLEQLASQIAMPLENSQLYAKAEKKARVDELTRLLNRRSLDEMIDSEISRHSRYGGAFSLAILDLDSFKFYNDTYGHLAGDGLLQDVGKAIKQAIRNADFAFRYGGDEFAILLPQTTMDAALQVLERVRKTIAETVKTDKISITTSIGLASWPEDGISHTDIIAAADVTLYRAKRNGGNQCLCASGPLGNIPEQKPALENPEDNINNKVNSLVRVFSEIIDSQSCYTNNHSKKVRDYAVTLANVLLLDKEVINRLELGAMLHDVGKIGISKDILSKSQELSPEEVAIFRTHPRLGADIVKQIPQIADCTNIILHHHEWYDGSGYPDGLKGNDIPLEARIISIAEAFVTMTSERSYTAIKTLEEAKKELRRYAGLQFDPALVKHFISIFEQSKDTSVNIARR
jgi:diguanylate cyclase (GGDEF)-like protein/putative nucleotidyltransferase with HDIG domain